MKASNLKDRNGPPMSVTIRLADDLDVSRGVLTERLDTLVAAGVVTRRKVGRTVEYELTPAGEELWPTLFGLIRWGRRHLDADFPARIFAHATCGTDLEESGLCPRCGVVPTVRDLDSRPGDGPNPRRRDDPVAHQQGVGAEHLKRRRQAREGVALVHELGGEDGEGHGASARRTRWSGPIATRLLGSGTAREQQRQPLGRLATIPLQLALLTLVAAPTGGSDAGTRAGQSHPTVSAR